MSKYNHNHVYSQKVPFSGRLWVCVNMSTTKKFPSLAEFQFVSTCLQQKISHLAPFSGKFSVCVYMSTTKKVHSLTDFEFVSTCLQPKGSFLWQFFSLYLHDYMSTMKNLPSLADFEFCVYMPTTKKFPSLAGFQFVSLCLHVYNQASFLIWQIFILCLHVYNHKAPFSLSFSVFVYLSTENLPSLPDIGFTTTYLHVYNQKILFSSRFSVCVYNQKAPFSGRFLVCVNVLTIEDFVPFVDIEFVSTCWHFYNQKSFLLWQILSLCLCVYISTAKKLPSLVDFYFQ